MGIDKGVGMSRRRAILMALLSTVNYATGFYVLDSPTGFPLGKTYQARMMIGSSNYYYESDYPMYIYKASDTTFYLAFVAGSTWRNGTALNISGSPSIGKVDGITYNREINLRSLPTSLCHTNYDMEFWG